EAERGAGIDGNSRELLAEEEDDADHPQQGGGEDPPAWPLAAEQPLVERVEYRHHREDDRSDAARDMADRGISEDVVEAEEAGAHGRKPAMLLPVHALQSPRHCEAGPDQGCREDEAPKDRDLRRDDPELQLDRE